MRRKLFISTDPKDIADRFSSTALTRGRPSLEVSQALTTFRRAIQELPSRELLPFFMSAVMRTPQDRISTILNVRQSNVSYRLERARSRLKLYNDLTTVLPETKLRYIMLDAGVPEHSATIVLGVLRTTSQTGTATAMNIPQGSIRNNFLSARQRLEKRKSHPPTAAAIKLINLVEAHFNQLRPIEIQKRWKWKDKIAQ